ncbi:hypothetical protein REPUB_Repub05bG0014800 [Reevesia pubescens]
MKDLKEPLKEDNGSAHFQKEEFSPRNSTTSLQVPENVLTDGMSILKNCRGVDVDIKASLMGDSSKMQTFEEPDVNSHKTSSCNEFVGRTEQDFIPNSESLKLAESNGSGPSVPPGFDFRKGLSKEKAFVGGCTNSDSFEAHSNNGVAVATESEKLSFLKDSNDLPSVLEPNAPPRFEDLGIKESTPLHEPLSTNSESISDPLIISLKRKSTRKNSKRLNRPSKGAKIGILPGPTAPLSSILLSRRYRNGSLRNRSSILRKKSVSSVERVSDSENSSSTRDVHSKIVKECVDLDKGDDVINEAIETWKLGVKLGLRAADETRVIKDLAFLINSMSVWNLLREFRIRKVQMAVVLNEYGGTVGEEIQKKTGYIVMRADGIFDVDANTSIDQLSEDLNIKMPEEHQYETVSGFVCEAFGYIPRTGESIKVVLEKENEEEDNEIPKLDLIAKI